MSITRRQFNKAGLGAGVLVALGDSTALAKEGLISRAIPSSGESIPIVGVGTNRYGVGDDAELRAPLQSALARFHQLGGTVIDTAPGYRSSERVLGDLIGQLGIGDDLFMATKVDREGRAESDERMEGSLKRLQMTEVDLMQVHNLRGWEDAIPLMNEWKQEGRIRYVGITTSRERQYGTMEQIMERHDLDFVQLNYSIANQRVSEERLIPLAKDRGMAVMVNRPFGGGGVFGKLSKTPFPEWARDFSDSWAQFMLKYALSRPGVTCAIPGMTKERHVEDNLAAATGRMPSADERKKQEAFFDAL